MKIITTTIVGALLAVVPFATPVVFAQTTVATTTVVTATVTPTVTSAVKSVTSIRTALQTQIAKLMLQIKALQVQIAKIKTTQQTIRSSFVALRSQMRVGSRGEGVKRLQRLLASDPSIYPQGLVTGYYGRLTKDAVKKFQENHGISPVGEVGPETRMLVNSFLKRATSTIPMNFLRRVEGEQMGTSGTDRTVSVCHRIRNSGKNVSQRVARRALFARIRQGDSVGECESERNGGDRSEGGDRGGLGHRSERSDMGERGSNNSITNQTGSGQMSTSGNTLPTSGEQSTNSNGGGDN